MMINFVKKTIWLCIIFFALSSNVSALNLEEEIAYYREIKKPLEEFLEDIQDFVGLENSGIFLRTVINEDYAATNYYAAHFMELYDFYAERLFSLVHLHSVDPFSIENEETLVIRQKIIDAIELIFYELEEICKAYLLPEKIEKINKMLQPNIGYKGTLKLFQRIQMFIKKYKDIFNHIYIHERDILVFSESRNDVKPNIVPALNLPMLKYEDIKKSSARVLKHLDVVIVFYIEKFNALLSVDEEQESAQKNKKVSMFDRFLHKKKEVEPIEPLIIVEESNAINTDNVLPIKRRSSSLLKSLSPRLRTQSLKKISVDGIKKVDSNIESQSTVFNTKSAEEIKLRKKRSSSILKGLTPRAITPRSPHGDGLNRGFSDSKISPKKIVPESTPRPKSGDDIIMLKRFNSLPHDDSDIISRAEIITNLEKLYLNTDIRTKKSKKDSKSYVAISPRIEKEKKLKKHKKKDKKHKKDKKKERKLSQNPVDKIKFSVPYENPFNE